ncbi:MAG: hypothetical protein WCT29_03445 [Candidatus Paceibacterota bacterium]|jgi:hypothetical protein
MDKNAKIFIGVIVVLVVGVILTIVLGVGPGSTSTGPGQYDEFATCLKDKGATFYGAFWCQHCQAQKKLFGSSQKLLPYVECSLPSGQGQTQACIDQGVKSYPTWRFADGSELTGEVALETLAAKTACVLPGEAATAQE